MMPFFEKNKKIKNKKGETGNSFRTNSKAKQTNLRTLIYKPEKPLIKQRRVSFFTSQKSNVSIELNASLAVEASIAMPIFLCAIYMFLTIINIFTLQSRVEYALHETAKEMALFGYMVNEVGVDETNPIMSLFIGETYVKERVLERIGKDYLEKSAVKNGASGLLFYKSSIMEEEDWIDLIVLYRFAPKFQKIGRAHV